jgi:predicted metal-dependent HD superfamily phosphohydrolase
MLDIDRLFQRWQHYDDRSLDRRNEQLGDSVFEQLVTAYNRHDRHYHNLTHIDRMLAIVDRFDDLQNPRAVYLATWFHDAVYDSQATDNEAKSAKLARDLLIDIGESIETIDRVERLILATQGHQTDPADPDLCIFLDADLAILGTDPVRYQAYQQAIRYEYSWVTDLEYQAGRTQVLESFLQRDRLYYTDLLFAELESIARANLKREITFLQG